MSRWWSPRIHPTPRNHQNHKTHMIRSLLNIRPEHRTFIGCRFSHLESSYLVILSVARNKCYVLVTTAHFTRTCAQPKNLQLFSIASYNNVPCQMEWIWFSRGTGVYLANVRPESLRDQRKEKCQHGSPHRRGGKAKKKMIVRVRKLVISWWSGTSNEPG